MQKEKLHIVKTPFTGVMNDSPETILPPGFPRDFGLKELPEELSAFKRLARQVDFQVYFPFAYSLSRFGFRKGDRLLAIGLGKIPFNPISAALIGGHVVAVESDGKSVESCEQFTLNLTPGKIGNAIRAAGGRIEYVSGDFTRMRGMEGRFRTVLLPNVLNQPRNPKVDEIASKALTAVEDGGHVILSDSHKRTGNDEEAILRRAADRLGFRLVPIKPANFGVIPIGLKDVTMDYAFRVEKTG